VDDLLDVSRISRGTIELRKEPVRLADAVTRAVDSTRPLVEARGHRLDVMLPAEPIWLDADPTRLDQVLGNLLNNAAKYTLPGGEILVNAERDGSWVVIRVADNGTGIPADLLPRVFELFTQAPRAPDRAQGGLGIGLSLVRSIVSLHGGSVEAKSDGPHKGSEFVVRLPVSPGRYDAHSGADQRLHGRAPRRIVIVDDNRDAADSMATLLRLQGHDVEVAYDGRSGLALTLSHRAEFAFVDIGLPEIDGHELARQLRAREGGKDIVLVALTGYGRDEDRVISKDAGFDHHLVKPVPSDALERLLGAGARG
jgi:CheY-like chemotaxis protein